MWIQVFWWYTDLFNWLWMVPALLAGYFAYRLCAAFLPLRPRRIWRIVLCVSLGAMMSTPIWVGDNNLFFTLPIFYGILLLCSKGNWTGRLTVCTIFFCMTMSACALMDTYLPGLELASSDLGFAYYDIPCRLARPIFWGLLYLLLRRRLPKQTPHLSPRLWRMSALLAAMPLSSMLAVVLLTQQKYDSRLLQSVTMNLGIAVLPFVFLTSLALLFLLLTLAETRQLEQAQYLASLRENYYETQRREETQLRKLRHDLRNHLMAVQGLLDQDEVPRAQAYLRELAGSPALGTGLRLCENETANAVLSAKLRTIETTGLTGRFTVSIPPALPIADPDLCVLLGSALDNAIEAAEQAEDKTIDLRCRVEKGLFMLRVENAVGGALNPDLSTTKPNKSAHGFGLAGMREIAQRCGGSLEIRAEAGRFELVACLPVIQPQVQ